jgi:hypothetical protein
MKRKIAAIFAADAVRGRNLRDAANQEEAPAPTSANAAPPPAPPPTPSGEKFAPETVPFVPDRARTILANEYVPAADYKALALNANGVNIFVTGEQNEEAAKTAAIDQCQKPRTLRGRRENASFTPAATWWSTRKPTTGAAIALDQARLPRHHDRPVCGRTELSCHESGRAATK